MRYGFAVDAFWPLQEVVKLIRIGEDLGYDNVWLPDQTFYADPFPLLAVAGCRTERIRLGIGVTNPYTRSIPQVARTIGTVAQLVGRPVALGIGAGNRRELLAPLGLTQTAPVERCREMIDLVRRLLEGERVTYESGSVTLRDVRLLFEPSHPVPIYLASRGQRMLRLGGELADGVIIGDLVSSAGLDYALREIAIGAHEAGRREGQVDLVAWVTCFITDGKRDHAEEYLRPWVAHHMAASPPAVQSAIGVDDERIQAIRAAYAAGGPMAAGALVSSEDIDKLAIVGSPDQCAVTVRRLVERKIGQLVILLYSQDLAENESTLRRFASEVIPQV